MRRRTLRLLFMWGLLLALPVLAAEAVSAWLLAGRDDPSLRPFLYKEPTILPPEAFARHLRTRDPLLGWPMALQLASNAHDGNGARPSPAFPLPASSCAAAFGDSFTYAKGASDEEAWPEQLSRMLGCRVSNYGVNGYGTDQAVLRFEAKAQTDPAPVVLLGFYAENVFRNLTQSWFFYTGGREPLLTVKPRFVLEAGGLRLIPPPALDHADQTRALTDPAELFPHETFLPGAPHGPVRVGFPYLLTMLRLLGKDQIQSALLGEPAWTRFLRPGHDAGGAELTAEILDRFHAACGPRRACLVVVLPSASSLRADQGGGERALAPFLRMLEERGVPSLDLTDAFLERAEGDRLCELFSQDEACSGHYSAAGNALVAEILAPKVRALREGLGSAALDPAATAP